MDDANQAPPGNDSTPEHQQQQPGTADPGSPAPAGEFTPAAPPWPQPAASAAVPQSAGKLERHQRSRIVAGVAALALVTGVIAGALGGTLAANAQLRRSNYTGGDLARSVSTQPAPSNQLEAAAQKISPSVVTIDVQGPAVSSGASASDTGSGVIIRSNGYILTNNHVVSAAATGGTVTVQFANSDAVPATIIGRDPSNDLAVIKVTGSGLPAATLANSDTLRLGQDVLAVGAPLGLSNTVTHGIISTLHRPVATGTGTADPTAVIDAIQTDASINPGNSGGPLVDLNGHVIGINSAIAAVSGTATTSTETGSIGVGFAIPANTAVNIADQLIRTGHAVHAVLGATSYSQLGDDNGARLAQISPQGPAADAGLRANDIITAIGGEPVRDVTTLIVAVRHHQPGDTVTVTYTRDGGRHHAAVTFIASTPS